MAALMGLLSAPSCVADTISPLTGTRGLRRSTMSPIMPTMQPNKEPEHPRTPRVLLTAISLYSRSTRPAVTSPSFSEHPTTLAARRGEGEDTTHETHQTPSNITTAATWHTTRARSGAGENKGGDTGEPSGKARAVGAVGPGLRPNRGARIVRVSRSAVSRSIFKCYKKSWPNPITQSGPSWDITRRIEIFDGS